MNKKDLPATKEDIYGIKTDMSTLKTDLTDKIDAMDARLSAKIDRVAMALVTTQTDMREMKAAMAAKDDVERIMRHIDGFAAQAIHYSRADATRGQALIKVEVMAEDHERRIRALEAGRPARP
jgi:hypothetical protein